MALEREKLAEIRQEAEKIKQAGADAAKSVVTLWSACLDMAIVQDDEELVNQLLKAPIRPGYFDFNFNCPSCGPSKK